MQVTAINKVMQENIAFTSEHNKIAMLYSMYHVPSIERVRLTNEFIRANTSEPFPTWLEKKLKARALDK